MVAGCYPAKIVSLLDPVYYPSASASSGIVLADVRYGGGTEELLFLVGVDGILMLDECPRILVRDPQYLPFEIRKWW